MFAYRLKKIIMLSTAVLTAAVCGVSLRVGMLSRFSAIEGERTFFLNSASSQGLRTEKLAFSDIGRVRGECVRFDLTEYEGGRYATNENSAEKIAEDIARIYGAEWLIIEQAGGSVCFYGYTERFTDKVFVNGQAVNLHIAVNGTACAVGSPIIFDGF